MCVEVRARRKLFWNREVHKIIYLLHALDYFISFIFVILQRFKISDFSAKNQTTRQIKYASFRLELVSKKVTTFRILS
eukprot:UN05089